jgi:transcriptional regulator
MGKEIQAAEGELLPGTLDMLILKSVSWRVMHGYDIARTIWRESDEVLRVAEGALYPALHRLLEKGLLAAEWGQSANNRRAKYYRLTPKGRKYLNAKSNKWERITVAVARVMQTA